MHLTWNGGTDRQRAWFLEALHSMDGYGMQEMPVQYTVEWRADPSTAFHNEFAVTTVTEEVVQFYGEPDPVDTTIVRATTAIRSNVVSKGEAFYKDVVRHELCHLVTHFLPEDAIQRICVELYGKPRTHWDTGRWQDQVHEAVCETMKDVFWDKGTPRYSFNRTSLHLREQLFSFWKDEVAPGRPDTFVPGKINGKIVDLASYQTVPAYKLLGSIDHPQTYEIPRKDLSFPVEAVGFGGESRDLVALTYFDPFRPEDTIGLYKIEQTWASEGEIADFYPHPERVALGIFDEPGGLALNAYLPAGQIGIAPETRTGWPVEEGGGADTSAPRVSFPQSQGDENSVFRSLLHDAEDVLLDRVYVQWNHGEDEPDPITYYGLSPALDEEGNPSSWSGVLQFGESFERAMLAPKPLKFYFGFSVTFYVELNRDDVNAEDPENKVLGMMAEPDPVLLGGVRTPFWSDDFPWPYPPGALQISPGAGGTRIKGDPVHGGSQRGIVFG